jgi:hypothetical protein
MKREVLAACQAEANAKRQFLAAKGAYDSTWTESGCSAAASRGTSPALGKAPAAGDGARSPLQAVVVGGVATAGDDGRPSRPSSPMEPMTPEEPGHTNAMLPPTLAPPSARVAHIARSRHRRSFSAEPSVIVLMKHEGP